MKDIDVKPDVDKVSPVEVPTVASPPVTPHVVKVAPVVTPVPVKMEMESEEFLDDDSGKTPSRSGRVGCV